jgi:hypothetical protein
MAFRGPDIAADDTVTVTGRGGTWVVDEVVPPTGNRPGYVHLTQTRTRGRYTWNTLIVATDPATLVYMRHGNAQLDECNKALAAAGIPALEAGSAAGRNRYVIVRNGQITDLTPIHA